MKTKIKTLSIALCAAIAVICFASCFATDPAAVDKKEYSSSYAWAMANGCNQKQAEIIATSNAESRRDEAMGIGVNTPGAPEIGMVLARLSDDMMAKALAAQQAGGRPRSPGGASRRLRVNSSRLGGMSWRFLLTSRSPAVTSWRAGDRAS